MKSACLLVIALLLPSTLYSQSAAKLQGTVYDAKGVVIADARVSAKDANGKKYESTTDTAGHYVLSLPFKTKYPSASYEIKVLSPGFAGSTIRNFIFVPASRGSMVLDIALDVAKVCDP